MKIIDKTRGERWYIKDVAPGVLFRTVEAGEAIFMKGHASYEFNKFYCIDLRTGLIQEVIPTMEVIILNCEVIIQPIST